MNRLDDLNESLARAEQNVLAACGAFLELRTTDMNSRRKARERLRIVYAAYQAQRSAFRREMSRPIEPSPRPEEPA